MHFLDNMIKLKEVCIIILYEDKESYRNLKNKIVFVSHVKESQNLVAAPWSQELMKISAFYIIPIPCLLLSQSKVLSSSPTIRPILQVAGWRKKVKNASFSLISLMAVPPKTFSRNLYCWHMASSINSSRNTRENALLYGKQ